ncbi:MAG: MBL fold metallo-hydrolase [Hadesarchaea archaeon]|nr:MBL fold metallo-hydrolase [Hadesarchaea archaeon]
MLAILYPKNCISDDLQRSSAIRMTTLTFYGGAGEIGGNQILLEDDDTRIWLDFGMPFSRANRYFSEFLQPRKLSGLGDWFEFGLMPDLPGLYREDYISRLREPSDLAFDAVLLTHAHADHSAYIHFLRPDLPIYASEVTKRILEALEVTSTTGFAEFLRLKETFKLVPKSKGEGFKRLQGKEAKRSRKFKVIGSRARIGNIEVEAFPVSHSLPGARAYLLHTSSGTIFYTGDFRFHGRGEEATRETVERVADVEVDAMLCEGTRVRESTDIPEAELERRITSEMRGVKGLVVVNFPPRDIDRMISFLRASEENDRKLVVSLRQAYLLKMLEGSDCGAPKLDDVCVYLPRKNWGLIGDPSYPEEVVAQDYEYWEREFLNLENAVIAEDIRESPRDYVFRCDFFELKNLIDIRPPKGSIYIRSVTEPFDEETEIDKRKADAWLKHFGLYPYSQIHCSGHAGGPELRRTIEDVSPELLIPVHTEAPEAFEEFHQNVKRVKLGQRIEL